MSETPTDGEFLFSEIATLTQGEDTVVALRTPDGEVFTLVTPTAPEDQK